MNAPLQINQKVTDPAIFGEVNCWRGACLQSFAEVEEAASEALAALATVEGRGKDIKLRLLLGQKLEDLATAIGTGGTFAIEGKSAAKALAEFRSNEDLRICLAHAVAHIVVERNRNWIVVLLRGSTTSKGERVTRTIDKAEALATQKELRRHSQSLCAQLRNLVQILPA